MVREGGCGGGWLEGRVRGNPNGDGGQETRDPNGAPELRLQLPGTRLCNGRLTPRASFQDQGCRVREIIAARDDSSRVHGGREEGN